MGRSINEIQIVRDIKVNSESTLRKLYLLHFQQVRKYILTNSGDEDHAKDIYQEAFTTFWKNVKEDKISFESESAIGGYIYQIAKFKWIDFLRSPEFNKRKKLNFDLTAESEHERIEKMEQEEARFRISKEAFQKLGEACRDVLMRYYFHKKSMRTIAGELAIDEASARNKKYRCLKKLQEIAADLK